jgi:hypothetical protein
LPYLEHLDHVERVVLALDPGIAADGPRRDGGVA